jgi:hypothetical protein
MHSADTRPDDTKRFIANMPHIDPRTHPCLNAESEFEAVRTAVHDLLIVDRDILTMVSFQQVRQQLEESTPLPFELGQWHFR